MRVYISAAVLLCASLSCSPEAGSDLPSGPDGGASMEGTTASFEETGSDCGNGVIDPGEQCDSENLDGESCNSLNQGSGTLTCDPVMCTYDTQMCDGTTGGTGSW